MTNRAVELSIIVPSGNERDRMAERVRRLDGCPAPITGDTLCVDDGTAGSIDALVRRHPRPDTRVQHRIGRGRQT